MSEVFLLKSGAAREGGLEKTARLLVEGFQQKGLPVTLVTSNGGAFQHNLPTLSCDLKSALSFRKVRAFDRFCEEVSLQKRPGIIFSLDRTTRQTHLRAGNGVHAAYLAQRALADPFFKKLTFSFNPLHRTLLHLEKTAFEHPELKVLFTNSCMVKDQILHYYNVNPEKIAVVHNGVEWHEYEKPFLTWKEGRKETASRLGLSCSLFHFLFIGHNFRRKGLDKLLFALSELPTQDFHLSVVGVDKHLSFFSSLVQKLGLGNRVTFFGEQKQILPFYQLADCLVIPSLYDPFANVTIEALAMGLFVVSSLHNGGHEILNEKTGVKIKDLKSIDTLSEALMTALHHPKTSERADCIRNSVKHLDFSHQLDLIIQKCLI